jgi:hypothetical protein
VPTEIPEPELSDDRAELEALLTAIMQKLQLEEPDVVSGKYAGVSVSAGEPEVKAENSIWENKKLIIEALPGYMFIQPTEDEPENSDVTPSEDKPKHYNNEPDIDEYGVDCHWYFVHGEWLCMYG